MSRVLVLSNPKSGRGRAEAVRRAVDAALRAAGHSTESLVPSEPDFAPRSVLALADPPKAVVVIGGDGSVHHAIPLLIGTSIPLYHVPLGTENLFSREFGMSRDPAALVRGLAAHRVRPIDVASCEAFDAGDKPTRRHFAIMFSLGPDASVIHRLDRVRTGPISHLSYVRPCVEESLAPEIPEFRVRVDGSLVTDWTRGVLVVANLRQYALRVDPARDATPDDGLLDVVVLRAESAAGAVARMVGSRLRRPSARTLTARGASVEVEARGARSQLDGEAFVAALTRATFAVEPASLRVLLPG